MSVLVCGGKADGSQGVRRWSSLSWGVALGLIGRCVCGRRDTAFWVFVGGGRVGLQLARHPGFFENRHTLFRLCVMDWTGRGCASVGSSVECGSEGWRGGPVGGRFRFP